MPTSGDETQHIRSLPLEVLVKVFEFCLGADNGSPSATRLDVALTCNYWKDVVFGFPVLWSNIRVRASVLSDDSSLYYDADQVRRALLGAQHAFKRSGDARLHFALVMFRQKHGGDYRQLKGGGDEFLDLRRNVFNLLQSGVDRIDSLHLEMPFPFYARFYAQRAASVELRDIPHRSSAFFENATGRGILKLSPTTLAYRTDFLELNWVKMSALKSLSLKATWVPFYPFLGHLRQSSQLEELSVDLRDFVIPEQLTALVSGIPPVQLRALRYLRCHLGQDLETLVGRLYMPNLAILEFPDFRLEAKGQIIRLLRSSPIRAILVNMSVMSDGFQWFIDALQTRPTIQTVYLLCQPSSRQSDCIDFMKGVRAVPSIERVRIFGPWSAVTVSTSDKALALGPIKREEGQRRASDVSVHLHLAGENKDTDGHRTIWEKILSTAGYEAEFVHWPAPSAEYVRSPFWYDPESSIGSFFGSDLS